MGTGDDEATATSKEADDVPSLAEYFRQEMPGYFRRRAELPALSWRARFLVAIPVALLLAWVIANDPRNRSSLGDGFAMSYPLFWLFSFLQFRIRPRAEAAMPRARVLSRGDHG